MPPVGTVSMQILQSAVPESPASSSVIALVGSDLMAASDADLEAVEGVGEARAKEIREGLRRLEEVDIVDRYT